MVFILMIIFGFGLLLWTIVYLFSTNQTANHPFEQFEQPVISQSAVGVETEYMQAIDAPLVSNNADFNPSESALSCPVVGQAWFDIGGAVLHPGIYTLPVVDKVPLRVYQLVELAGGFSNDANQLYIARNFNLAEVITDGQKIYIPFTNEELPLVITSGGGGESGIKKEVSVNESSLNELKMLTGVGDARATNIINNRPYQSLEELVERKILTSKILDDNRDRISL